MAVAVLLRQRALSSPHAVSLCRNGTYYLGRLDPWALPMGYGGWSVCLFLRLGSGDMCSVECQNQTRPLQTLPTSGGISGSLYLQVISSITVLCFMFDWINEQLEKAIIFLFGCDCSILFFSDE